MGEKDNKRKVYCSLYKTDITKNEFTQDSEVPGLLDLGYECTACQVDVMKVVNQKTQNEGVKVMEPHIQYALQVVEAEISKLQKQFDKGHFLPEDREAIRLDIQRLSQSVTEIKEKFTA